MGRDQATGSGSEVADAVWTRARQIECEVCDAQCNDECVGTQGRYTGSRLKSMHWPRLDAAREQLVEEGWQPQGRGEETPAPRVDYDTAENRAWRARLASLRTLRGAALCGLPPGYKLPSDARADCDVLDLRNVLDLVQQLMHSAATDKLLPQCTLKHERCPVCMEPTVEEGETGYLHCTTCDSGFGKDPVVAVCNAAEHLHVGPWERIPFSDQSERCMACGYVIGK